jgi:hypothetical protein
VSGKVFDNHFEWIIGVYFDKFYGVYGG